MNERTSDQPVRMTIPDMAAAIVAAAVAAWIVIESRRWPAPDFVGGPAVVPLLVAAVLFVCAGLLLRMALLGRSSVVETPLQATQSRRIAIMVAATAVYAGGLEVVGFLPATIVYLAVFTTVLGLRNRLMLVGYSVLLPCGFYLLFALVLKVPLPPAQWPF
jgi:high-affinity Fe2+/Pb2+ permease